MSLLRFGKRAVHGAIGVVGMGVLKAVGITALAALATPAAIVAGGAAVIGTAYAVSKLKKK